MSSLLRIWGLSALLILPQTLLAEPLEPVYESYQVKETGESLTMIALRLYGNTVRWKQIAALNEMTDPFRIKVGQRLKIPVPATRSQAEGDRLVLDYWRKRLGPDEPTEGPSEALAKEIVIPEVVEPAKLRSAPKEERVAIIEQKVIEKDSLTGKTEFRKEWLGDGVDLLRERDFEKAFDYFAALEKVSSKEMPKNENLILIEGPQAEHLFKNLSKNTQAVSRSPASKTLESTAPDQIRFANLERRMGKDIACAKVPLVSVGGQIVRDRKKHVVFQFRCVGYVER